MEEKQAMSISIIFDTNNIDAGCDDASVTRVTRYAIYQRVSLETVAEVISSSG